MYAIYISKFFRTFSFVSFDVVNLSPRFFFSLPLIYKALKFNKILFQWGGGGGVSELTSSWISQIWLSIGILTTMLELQPEMFFRINQIKSQNYEKLLPKINGIN